MKTATITTVLSVCLIASAHAADLGRLGRVYEIHERDMLEWIEMRLREMEAEGRFELLKKEAQQKAEAYVQRPPGARLPRAAKHRRYYYDPSIVLNEDVRDAQGRLLYAAGTRANPLEYVQMPAPMVFFDGDDEQQREWVYRLIHKTPEQYITVMTNGAVMELMKEWKIRLYFDQRGVYVEKFGIRALPAVVRQEGYALRIDEIPLE